MRSLRSAPLVSVLVVSSVALGVGANTAIFSIVNGLLLRPLPVRDPDNLAVVMTTERDVVSYPLWQEIARRSEVFEGSLAWSSEQFNIAAHGESDFVDGLFVSGTFFDVLGVRPLVGRAIRPDDDRPGTTAAIIGYRFWQQRLGGATDVVGKPLSIGRAVFEIGIRMALGAQPGIVAGMILKRVVTLITVGVLVGAGAGLWVSQYVATLLYGLQPHDPAALTAAAGILAVIGLLAGWLPARQAARIDPAEARRTQ